MEKISSSGPLCVGPDETFFLAIQTMNFHFPEPMHFRVCFNGFVSFEIPVFRKCIIWMIADPKAMRWQAEHWGYDRPG
jgi:hypothetical protein